jgi:hypothetical protein
MITAFINNTQEGVIWKKKSRFSSKMRQKTIDLSDDLWYNG